MILNYPSIPFQYLDAKSKIELSISLMTVVLQTNVSTLIYTLTAESHTALNTGRVQRACQPLNMTNCIIWLPDFNLSIWTLIPSWLEAELYLSDLWISVWKMRLNMVLMWTLCETLSNLWITVWKMHFNIELNSSTMWCCIFPNDFKVLPKFDIDNKQSVLWTKVEFSNSLKTLTMFKENSLD